MSYDLRFAVKAEDGRFVDFCEPELANPTYNLGMMFRKAMGWDFNQGEYYRVSDVLENISAGYLNLTYHRDDYVEYEPNNGWGTVEGAADCLKSIMDKISEIQNWDHIPLNIVYFAW